MSNSDGIEKTRETKWWTFVNITQLFYWIISLCKIHCFIVSEFFCIPYMEGKFGGGKIWRNDSFRAFGESKFREIIDQPIDY